VFVKYFRMILNYCLLITSFSDMNIKTFEGITGKTSFSPNNIFFVIRQCPRTPKHFGKVLLGRLGDSKSKFIKDIKYPDYFEVSDNGFLVGCNINHDYDDYFTQALLMNQDGKIIFQKESNCPITATAISADGALAAFAFAGDEKYLECYSIYIVATVNSQVVQIKPIPDSVSVTKMEFDSVNSLKAYGTS
jgi:hypothetical protein